MIFVDAKILLYGYDSESPHHTLSRQWIENHFSSGRSVALAVEHGARIATTDRDFARFAGIKTLNPLETG